MNSRKLGNTDIMLSEIRIGCASIWGCRGELHFWIQDIPMMKLKYDWENAYSRLVQIAEKNW